MAENKLTDKQINAYKPQEKLTKLSDGKGLFLCVFPHGSKLWRYHYRMNGKQKTFSMGAYLNGMLDTQGCVGCFLQQSKKQHQLGCRLRSKSATDIETLLLVPNQRQLWLHHA